LPDYYHTFRYSTEAYVQLSEPVLSSLFLSRTRQDAEDPPEIGDLDEIFCCVSALLPMSAQPSVAIGQRAEGRLDPPSQRQRGEATDGRLAERHLHLHVVARRSGTPRRPRLDAVGLDPLETPAGGIGLRQERRQAGRLVEIGGRDEHSQDEAERASQDMALDAVDLLVRVDPACAFLRPGRNAWRIHDPGRRRGVLAEARPGGRGEQDGKISPASIAVEAVPVAADRLPCRLRRHPSGGSLRDGPNSLGSERHRQPSAAK
jgi:hypothetical protein